MTVAVAGRVKTQRFARWLCPQPPLPPMQVRRRIFQTPKTRNRMSPLSSRLSPQRLVSLLLLAVAHEANIPTHNQALNTFQTLHTRRVVRGKTSCRLCLLPALPLVSITLRGFLPSLCIPILLRCFWLVLVFSAWSSLLLLYLTVRVCWCRCWCWCGGGCGCGCRRNGPRGERGARGARGARGT